MQNLLGKFEGGDLLEWMRKLLKYFVEKQGAKVCTGFIWLRIGTSGGLCKHDNELSVSIKGDEFLE
jgi:hypothetical protein